jgi:hypothetical protein
LPTVRTADMLDDQMRISQRLVLLLIIVSVVWAAQGGILVGAERPVCPDCAQDADPDGAGCGDSGPCVCCPLRMPTAYQPEGPAEPTPSAAPCLPRSDVLVLTPQFADIFHPPRIC